MPPGHDDVRRADRLIWTTIAAIAAAVAASCIFGSFHIDWLSFWPAALAASLLCVAGQYYLVVRNDPRAASALTCTAQLAVFAAVGAPLSYVAASAALPLWDETFWAWDGRLGLDWMALLGAMNNHPALHRIFAAAYQSYPVQSIIVVLALAATGRILRLRVYLLSFMLTALVTIAVSVVMPAQGVWGHMGLSAADYAIPPVTRELHLSIFHGLRDGTFRDLVAQGAQGIITFPSLHTAIGILFITAMWPVRYLRWAAMLVNITMIAATPVDGGHYFTDVIAGAAVAALCWTAVARIFGTVSATPLKDIAIVSDPPSIVPDTISATEIAAPSRKLEPI
jgi:membrane-associated phospholipid phosphatase